MLGYLTVVLIWGTTWFAVATQVNGTSPHVAVAIRLSLASSIFFALLFATGQRLRLRRDQAGIVLVQGLCFFGLNYAAVYSASQYLTSGVLAVVFSVTVPFNILAGWAIERKLPQLAIVFAALIGVAGIGVVFASELVRTPLTNEVLWGAGLAVFAALIVAVGNVVAAGFAAAEIGAIRLNAYGFGVGAIAIVLWGLLSGAPWLLELTPKWVAGQAYLVFIGSVVAHGIYIKILPRIGAVAGAYVVVLSPLIAMAISAVFEGLPIGPWAVAGIALLLCGHSILVFRGLR